MPERPLNRHEIADLVDRVRGLIAMVEADQMSATTAMTYRLQGAVTALDAVMGRKLTVASFDDYPLALWQDSWRG